MVENVDLDYRNWGKIVIRNIELLEIGQPVKGYIICFNLNPF